MKQESMIRKIINGLLANQEIVVVNLSQKGFLLGNMPKEGPFTHTCFFGYREGEGLSTKTIDMENIVTNDIYRDHQVGIEVAPKRDYVYVPEELQSSLDKLVCDLGLTPDHHNNFKIRGYNLELGSVLYKEEIGKKSIDCQVKFTTNDPELENLCLNFYTNSKGQKEITTSHHKEGEINRYITLTFYPDPLLAAICSFDSYIRLEELEEYRRVIKEKKNKEEIISALIKIWPSSGFSRFAESMKKYSRDRELFNRRYGYFLEQVRNKVGKR
jgi:hypothetical protein